MITDDPICVSSGVRLLVCARYLSVKLVVESLEKTITKVHIADRINSFWELHAAWKLTIAMAPIVLNAFHVPLVYKDNNLLAF